MFHAIVAHFFLEVVRFCRPKRNNPTRADKARVGLGRCGRRGAARGWGAQEGAGRLAAKGERHGAMGTGRAIAVERGRRGRGGCPKKCVRFSFVLPLRLGVPQAGGEFVMLIFLCRFT